jgi:predicted nucleic acid-binding protein
MIVIDSDVLLLVLDPDAAVPPVPMARERVNYLLQSLSESRTQVLVPAPVLAEILVKAGAATQDYLAVLRGNPNIRIAPFDERAAVECAVLIKAELQERRTTRGMKQSRDKVKFDQQIVAISRSTGAEYLLSNDSELRASAEKAGLLAKGLKDLEVPTEARQATLELKPDEIDKN